MLSFFFIALRVTVDSAFVAIWCRRQQFNVLRYSRKVPNIFVQFYENLDFLDLFS
jgi:hypothetical protein